MVMSRNVLVALNALISVAFVGALTVFAQTADTTPPVISGVGTSGISQTTATISWTTDEPADTQVEYGTSTAYGLSSVLNTATSTAHSVALSGLTASTTYHFMVKSKDVAGNSATSSDYSLTTLPLPPADTTAPVISAVSVSGISQTTGQVNWTTGESATGRVFYGTSTAYGLSSALQTATTTAHTIGLTGMTSATTYHFIVVSQDVAGNTATSSDYLFTTLATDTTPPTISSVSVSGITQNTASVNWNTNEASDSQVQYGTTTSYGASTALQPAFVTGHTTALSGLTASTTYHFMVVSKDSAGNSATSSDGTFTTLVTPATTPPPTTGDVTVGLKVSPKTINAKSKGKWVEVRVTFPEGYDARDTNLSSIKLNGTLSPERVKVKAKKHKKHDDDDDDDDRDRESRLHMKFSRNALINLLSSGVSATSTATTTDSKYIEKQVTITGTIGTKTFGGSSVVRLRQTTDLPNGLVLRSEDGSEVYIIINGKKRHIPSLEAFRMLGLSWSDVQVVARSVVESSEDEMLLKSADNPKVYLISGGKKRHITDPAAFEGQGLDWDDITVVSAKELNFYQSVSGVTLMRTSGDAKVYFITGGERQWVPSESVFKQRGFKWEDIVIVDESERDKYKEGKKLD